MRAFLSDVKRKEGSTSLQLQPSPESSTANRVAPLSYYVWLQSSS
jgi:hypothetical protein